MNPPDISDMNGMQLPTASIIMHMSFSPIRLTEMNLMRAIFLYLLRQIIQLIFFDVYQFER